MRLSELAQLLPRWAARLMFVLMGYALVNFFLFMAATEGGSPSQLENGQFVLQNHGKLIRVLTAPEFTAFKANEVRGFFWALVAVLFCAVCVFFSLRRRRKIL